jgi:hypothetical protein
LQAVSVKDRFHRAKVRPGANERFISALAEQKLQRADNDGFTGAGFSRNGDKPGPHLPLEFLD